MSTAEIDIILQQGEGYNVEFKQSIAKDIPEEICAFANAAGGTLLIGVKNDNSLCGISIDNNTRSRIVDSLNVIDPRIDFRYEEIDYGGKKLIALTCGTGKQKPYTVSGAIYIRIGPNSQRLTSVQEMRDFFQQSERIYFDDALCPAFRPATDFDTEAFHQFLGKAGITHAHDQDTLVENLKLVSGDGQFKNGAVLFFGKDVQAFFDKATIRCVQYKGLDKRFIIDDKIMRGNLLHQYDEAITYIRSKLNLSYEIESQGTGPRREIYEIPEIVFKEALINALTHRDYYDKGATIMIELFDDRFEITNPGGLLNGIPRDQFGKRSLSRNPLLFGLFERIDMVEQVGSGIARMKDAMRDAGLPEPVFGVEGMFSVVLSRPVDFDQWLHSMKDEFSETRIKIIELINDNPAISKSVIARTIAISTTAVDRHISALREAGILARVGAAKGGRWKVIPKKPGL